jgi:hypothetical protein
MRVGKPRSKRAARKGERFIGTYQFPDYIWKRVRKRAPNLDEAGMRLVERGLREWFVCCAWRGRAVLGMPSRLVDEAWHEFILDSLSYTDFCEKAFGGYLHHMPDEAMENPFGETLGETVRAWDRSEAGKAGESILWDLDKRLGVEEPLGVHGLQLANARSRAHHAGGVGSAYYGGDTWLIGGGGGGDAGGSDGGGGGCGGGCGGGS